MTSAARSVFAVVTCVLAACDEKESEAVAASVRDSAGITIVESRRPASADTAGWSVGGAPTLALGEGPEGDFHDVAGVIRLSDGTIAVGNGGSGEVRFFDGEGVLVGSVGGRGEGPGEFLLLQSLGIGPDDTVWIYDYQLQRVSLVTAPGTLIRTAALRPRLPSGVPVGTLPDGSLLMAQMWGSGDPAAPLVPGVTREAAAYVRYDDEGILVDTVGLFPGREVLLSLEDGRPVMGVVPFGRTASHAVLPEGFVVGDQEAYELGVFSADGVLERIVRWTGPSLDLEESAVDEWRALQVSSAPPDRRAEVRARLADVPVPDTRPAYRDLVVDEEGELWVGAYAHPSEGARRWDVFGSSGQWLASVRMPSGFTPRQVGSDWILGVARDALGVERVELRSLRR
jgi:hypothetical protein